MTAAHRHPGRVAGAPSDMAREHACSLDLFGTSVRLLVGPPANASTPPAPLAAAAAAALLRRHQQALTRFDQRSELSLLNADPAAARRVSDLTADAVAAALWAAERSGGLVDPTLIGELERAGYAHSRAGAEPAPLRDALRAAPARRAARPSAAERWRTIAVTGDSVGRPAGVRLDLGGTAKGRAADRAAALLDRQTSFAVDAGGDIVLGGASGMPRRVSVAHPLDSEKPAFAFELVDGAVATSGLATRLWRTPTGYAHHLIDPSTGLPAWTGVIQATAVARTGLEAETLAKTALLRGPEAGLSVLQAAGGVLILDDGRVLVAGSLRRPLAAAA